VTNIATIAQSGAVDFTLKYIVHTYDNSIMKSTKNSAKGVGEGRV
jgi:hypothetical protein